MTDDGGYLDDLIKWRLVTTGPMHMTLKVFPSWENHGPTTGIFEKGEFEDSIGWESVMLIGYGQDSMQRDFWVI